ncbi:hypothetical protein SNE40_016567 [Patella caerulea]|uniref:Transmembrane protein n=1 Tax=Patella caerulea TaxID=87958 RepID=A0AAN8JDB9_PATCE
MKAVLILVVVAVISSRSYVDACDAVALASCTLPTPGSANICNSLATYKTCVNDAACLSGAVETGYNAALTAAKCGACNAKISLSVMSLTAAFFFLKKMM